MHYHESFANGIIIKREDENPTSFEDFRVTLLDAISKAGDLVGWSNVESNDGNDHYHYYFAAITGENRALCIYRIDREDYERFVDGKYVVLPYMRETTWEEVESTEFVDGFAA